MTTQEKLRRFAAKGLIAEIRETWRAAGSHLTLTGESFQDAFARLTESWCGVREECAFDADSIDSLNVQEFDAALRVIDAMTKTNNEEQ